jgi:hypothetical protein
MLRLRRSAVNATDDVRQGSGPIDNLVVLITSLLVLTAIGVAFAMYFGYWPLGR